MGTLPPSGSRARWVACHLAEEAAAKVRLVRRLEGAGVPGHRGRGSLRRQEGGTGQAAPRTTPGRGPPGVMQQTAAERPPRVWMPVCPAQKPHGNYSQRREVSEPEAAPRPAAA